jgi:hypothetical protein
MGDDDSDEGNPMADDLDPDVGSIPTKTMTCRQLGGPCDLAHRGDDPNEIITSQDRHLNEAVAAGSTDHELALKAMKGRWRRPISGLKWYRQVQRDFAALPDEPAPITQAERTTAEVPTSSEEAT